MPNNAVRQYRVIGITAVLCIIYAFTVRYTPLRIPCLFHEVTGLKCPGCGMTHMAAAFMDMDIAGMFASNAFVFLTLPVLGAVIALQFFVPGMKEKTFTKVLTLAYAVCLVSWGFLRNIADI